MSHSSAGGIMGWDLWRGLGKAEPVSMVRGAGKRSIPSSAGTV